MFLYVLTLFSLAITGFIGKITLQIPFYRPHADPWVISVSKLHLIGSLEKQEDFDEEKERLFEKESKAAILLALEEKWKVSCLGALNETISAFGEITLKPQIKFLLAGSRKPNSCFSQIKMAWP